ncbi:hypothetical protein ACFYNX_25225 [Streptomyces sp. NPDC007872]|uniref:hypothetical protein n=1 Tax=Streptomyces sp. NPDC007872 TaxID=3364782 RepID=UPI003687E566
MSPAPEPTAAPAAPAGRRARPGRHRRVVLLLVLAALFGAGAPALLSGASPLPAAAAAPASDPGGETHDQAAADTALPGRTRRHCGGLRPAGTRRRPRVRRGRRRDPLPAPVPASRADALRCVVMRC